jgi:beta-N-acetylhexosaminidase
MTRRREGAGRRLAVVIAAVTIAAQLSVGGGSIPVAVAATPTVAQLIGQKLVIRMDGTTPSAALLGRIRRGEVGGVILFGANVVDATQVAALTTQLHQAAIDGGQPRLLVMVDQEGGTVKRIPWAPPTLSPPQMGALGSTTTARLQGYHTAEALRALGIDVDLAPVADVPVTTKSFEFVQKRTWSFNPSRTAYLAYEFAHGIRIGGVIPAMKHFPGLGFATSNTDQRIVTIFQPASALAPGLQPFKVGIAHAIPLIMLSNATYPAWDRSFAAGWSPAVNTTLLRTQLGFKGATITDALDGTAAARHTTAAHLALRAAQSGTDLLLVTGSESTSQAVYNALVTAANAGQIPTSKLSASLTRILALKALAPGG